MLPCIKPITLLITPSETIITEPRIFLYESYLRIDIIPDESFETIKFIKVKYCSNSIIKFEDEITDEPIFELFTQCIIGDEPKLIRKIAKYMQSLQQEEISVISNVYTKYMNKDGVILDGFITGIGAFVAFILLNETDTFFPFSINIGNGMIISSNILRHISLPLSGLSKIVDGIVLNFVLFLMNFINIWEPMFVTGDTIEINAELKVAIDVISGLSLYILDKSNKQINLDDIESKLRKYTDDKFAMLNTRNLPEVTSDDIKALKETLLEMQTKFLDESVKLQKEEERLQNMEERIKRLELLSAQKNIPITKPSSKVNNFFLKDVVK